jgi:hypothetical protein
MSHAIDPVKRTSPSIVCEVPRADGIVFISACNFSNMSSAKDTSVNVGFQKTNDGWKQVVETDPGNMFAKKINLRDNFFTFSEFLNKYKDFVYVMEAFWIRLISLYRFNISDVYLCY